MIESPLPAWKVSVGGAGAKHLPAALDVRVANPAGFVAQKLLIHGDRVPKKRAQDVSTLTRNQRKRIHELRRRMFRSVTDVIRDAVLIPVDRLERLGSSSEVTDFRVEVCGFQSVAIHSRSGRSGPTSLVERLCCGLECSQRNRLPFLLPQGSSPRGEQCTLSVAAPRPAGYNTVGPVDPPDHGVRVRENSVATLALKSAARLGLALLVLVAACSGDGPSSPVPANEVRVSNNAFSPASRTIAVGTTLTWRWVSGSSTHNVAFSGGPTSPDQASGTFARLFSAAGTFAYQCTIHGGSMSGSVTVQ